MKKQNRLVVANAGWAETLPAWLKEEIKNERLVLGLASVVKPAYEVGDAELCAYLYTASLAAPMPRDYSEIYVYATARVMQRRSKDMPDFMKQKLEAGLTQDEEREYRGLKRELYTKRGGEVTHPVLDALREMKKMGRKDRGDHE